MSTNDAEPSTDAVRPGEDSSRSLAEEIAATLAAERGCRPDVLELRLYDAVDPDVLEAPFAPYRDGTPRPHGRLVFEIGAFEVRVAADRSVSVAPVE